MPSQIVSPKRKAIADSSRTMFGWVAGMSAVVGICAVIGVFLGQQIAFKVSVVNKMSSTLSTLRENNKVASGLTDEVRALNTNAALNSIKANPDEQALQVVLDALPADRNSLALGSSLQQVLLSGIDGLTVDSMTVDGDASSTDTGSSTDGADTIPIQLQVTATNANAIKDMLTRLERSIRVVDITNFVLERGESSYQATITAQAYYTGPQEVKLGETTVRPGGKK